MRTYNLTPGRELRHGVPTSTTPCTAASRGPGRLDVHRAAKRGCEAGALPGAGPAQPDGRNGGRLRPPDPGRNPGGRQHDGGRGGHDGLGPAAEARVPRRRGRRRHAGHPGRGAAGAHPDHINQLPGALQQRGSGFTVGGFELEGYAMTLSAFAWNIVRTYT